MQGWLLLLLHWLRPQLWLLLHGLRALHPSLPLLLQGPLQGGQAAALLQSLLWPIMLIVEGGLLEVSIEDV